MIDKIYIPTLGRVDNQITFDNLPQKYQEIVTLVVTESERPLHKRDCNYLVTEDNIGIAKTRKQIMYDGGKINLRDMIINSFEKQLAKSNNELKTKN